MNKIVRNIYKFLKSGWPLSRLYVKDDRVCLKSTNSKVIETLQDYFGSDPALYYSPKKLIGMPGKKEWWENGIKIK